MPETSTLETAADALLRAIVALERQRVAAHPPKPIRATPFVLRDPDTIPWRDALDLRGLTTDPVGTACRAELRRIGQAIHAADPGGDLADTLVEIAEADPSHAGWRAAVLESAWAGIGGMP